MECPYHLGTALPVIVSTRNCPRCGGSTAQKVIAHGPCQVCHQAWTGAVDAEGVPIPYVPSEE